jgi:Family of unknown function (DUF6166)
MSRHFIGTRYKDHDVYDVHVEYDGKSYSLTHKLHGLDAGFRWGGGGPASTDLARALLWMTTGTEPEWRMCCLFKNDVVSAWPRQDGECWRISEEEIRQWLAEVEQETARTESAGQTKVRLDQAHGRESRLRRAAATFGGRQH